jgi:hypothetical protein
MLVLLGCGLPPVTNDPSTSDARPPAHRPLLDRLSAAATSHAVAARPVLDGINSGLAYVFTMDQPLGDLQVGKKYLFRRDGHDNVSSISDYRSINAYPSPAAPDVLNVWSVEMRVGEVDGEGVCLLLQSQCIAHLRATLFGTKASEPLDPRELVYQAYFDRAAEQTSRLTPGDLINGSDVIKIGSELLPFVSQADVYRRLADNLDGIVASAESSFHPTPSDLTLNALLTGPFETTLRLSEALTELHDLNPDPQLSAYLGSIAEPAMTTILTAQVGTPSGTMQLADYFETDATFDSTPLYVSFYLDVALDEGLAGVYTINRHAFVPMRTDTFLQFQDLTDAACLDSKPMTSTSDPSQTIVVPQQMTLSYGGFTHLAGGTDCVQDLYHSNGYVMQMLRLWKYMKPVCASGDPTAYLYDTCGELPNQLLAALAWNNSLLRDDGGAYFLSAGNIRTPPPGYATDWVGDPHVVTPNYTNWSAYNSWLLIGELQPYFEGADVKVDFNGATKPFKTLRADALKSVDFMVRDWEAAGKGDFAGLPWFLGAWVRSQAATW